MNTAQALKPNNVFESISESEVEDLFSKIYSNSTTMVGRNSQGVAFVFKPSSKKMSFSVISGTYRSNGQTPNECQITFSFVIEQTKYLFKGQLTKLDQRRGNLSLLTNFYRIQRRHVKRLIVPMDYYAVIRLSHQNSRMIRSFGKLMDISPLGMGILLPKDDIKLNLEDRLKVVLTMNQRPPENLELRVIHMGIRPRPMEKNDQDRGEGLFFGAMYLPEKSVTVFRRMNVIVQDIYRDLFGIFSENN